jgi:hypothetical protein
MASMASMAFGAHSSVELLAMVEQGKLRLFQISGGSKLRI